MFHTEFLLPQDYTNYNRLLFLEKDYQNFTIKLFLFNKVMIPKQMLRCLLGYNARNWLSVHNTNLHT